MTGHARAKSPGPQLAAPHLTISTAESQVEVSISFDPNGEAIAGVQFSLDIDPECLVLPQADGDGDGIPDSVEFTLPPAVAPYFTYSASETAGEIDIALVDEVVPFMSIPAGPVVTLTFDVVCAPVAPAESRMTEILFAVDPMPSFGNTEGASVDGGSTSGSVTIMNAPTATPETPTPETPTPETPTPETPTPETPTPETPTPETPTPETPTPETPTPVTPTPVIDWIKLPIVRNNTR